MGGSGSGKSFIAKYMVSKLNGLFIEADKVGHELLKDTNVINELVDCFGEGILHEGLIDRRTLGQKVFGSQEALAKLNAIMHPKMYKLIEKMIVLSKEKFIILEAAVMIEARFYELVDQLLWVDCEIGVRQDRLVKFRQIDPDRAEKMIHSTKRPYDQYATDKIDTTNGFDAIQHILDLKLLAYEEAYNESLI